MRKLAKGGEDHAHDLAAKKNFFWKALIASRGLVPRILTLQVTSKVMIFIDF